MSRKGDDPRCRRTWSYAKPGHRSKPRNRDYPVDQALSRCGSRVEKIDPSDDPFPPSSSPVVSDQGARIMLSGGYDLQPSWLGGRDAVFGIIEAWIPGQNDNPACVVKLDSPLTAESDVRGRRQTVTGRHADQVWGRTGTVHVELCEAMPASRPWADRTVGAWVESYASYEKISA